MIFAEVGPSIPDLGPLVQGGAMGLLALVLWWVMGRQTEAIKENGQAIRESGARIDARLDSHGRQIGHIDQRVNRMVNAMLLEVLTRDNTPPNVRAQAEKMLSQQEE